MVKNSLGVRALHTSIQYWGKNLNGNFYAEKYLTTAHINLMLKEHRLMKICWPLSQCPWIIMTKCIIGRLF